MARRGGRRSRQPVVPRPTPGIIVGDAANLEAEQPQDPRFHAELPSTTPQSVLFQREQHQATAASWAHIGRLFHQSALIVRRRTHRQQILRRRLGRSLSFHQLALIIRHRMHRQQILSRRHGCSPPFHQSALIT